jgi:hypothetical protein
MEPAAGSGNVTPLAAAKGEAAREASGLVKLARAFRRN